MREEGATLPHLYFEYYAVDFRGVCIDSDLADDTILVNIPTNLLMTVEKAKESKIGTQIAASGCRLRSHAYVACYLLQERKDPNSFWKPYIDVLPKSYRNIPTQFTEEELYYLRGSLTLEEVQERQENYTNEYADICSNVPSFAEHSVQDYFWARLVVLTRIFGINVNSSDTSALVPFSDMLNHKYPAETHWTFDQGLNSFTITSQKAFVKGEQVYDSYGRKCNTEFFMNYGFVPSEPNPNNECKLILSFPEDTDLYAYKMLLLPSDLHQVQVSRDYDTDECSEMWYHSLSLSLSLSRFSLLASRYRYIDIHLSISYSFSLSSIIIFVFLFFVSRAFLRLGFCTAPEFFQLTGGGYEVNDPKDISPRNLRNEMEVLRNLSLFASESLAEFDTSLEEDEELLANAVDNNINRNIYNAIMARKSEKEVLEWYITMCDTILDFLDDSMTKERFEELCDDDPFINQEENARYSIYIYIYIPFSDLFPLKLYTPIELIILSSTQFTHL